MKFQQGVGHSQLIDEGGGGVKGRLEFFSSSEIHPNWRVQLSLTFERNESFKRSFTHLDLNEFRRMQVQAVGARRGGSA